MKFWLKSKTLSKQNTFRELAHVMKKIKHGDGVEEGQEMLPSSDG